MTESHADATPIAREEAPHLMADEVRFGRRTRLLVLTPLAYEWSGQYFMCRLF
jgi:hypothetical protein